MAYEFGRDPFGRTAEERPVSLLKLALRHRSVSACQNVNPVRNIASEFLARGLRYRQAQSASLGRTAG